MKTNKKTCACVLICTLAVSGFSYMHNKKEVQCNSLLEANILALTEGKDVTNIAKVVTTGSGMYVTYVDGSMSGKFSLGMRLSKALDASLEGKVKAEAKDEFKIDCVYKEGANAVCVKEKWHMCASSGCPKDGTFVK
ncbi:MAG: hypothetical protein K2F69_02305 [Bacteroidaceae bacterium]|nr:hypothetical protein [Bacteroidaceae bacterium]